MLPVPSTPSVLPISSRPEANFFFSHLPARVLCEASAICRASASSSARVCSATETLFPPGAFITTTPRPEAHAHVHLRAGDALQDRLGLGGQIVADENAHGCPTPAARARPATRLRPSPTAPRRARRRAALSRPGP